MKLFEIKLALDAIVSKISKVRYDKVIRSGRLSLFCLYSTFKDTPNQYKIVACNIIPCKELFRRSFWSNPTSTYKYIKTKLAIYYKLVG